MVCADTVTEPAAPEPALEALMLLCKPVEFAGSVESRRSLPLALTVTVPPFPQPVLAAQLALEEMTEPASRLMVCPDTVTEPALPEPVVEALMLLGTPAKFFGPVESRMISPPALTVTVPPFPQPAFAQLALEEITEPASRLMFCADTVTDPAAPEPRLFALIVLAKEDPVVSRTISPVAVTLTVPPFPQPELAVQTAPEAM